MQKLVTATLLGILLTVSVSLSDGSADTASAAEPTDGRPVALAGADREILFLRDGRTIQAEGSETLDNRVRIETPTERIDLPSSAVLSIHRMEAPAGSSGRPAPAEVYRGLTQQMTDQVRGQIQELSRPPRVK